MKPKECEKTQLRKIVTIEKGKPPAKQPFFEQNAELYLTPEYLRGRNLAEPVLPGSNAVRVKDGDTILLWDGSNAGEFFRAREGVLASTMVRIWHDDTYDNQYFYYAVKNWELFLKGQTSGSGIPHVDKEILGNIEILKYSKPEQTKIAKILSTVDEAIEQIEALINKQQRIKTGLMQELLTRGIDEYGNIRSEQTHKFKDSPLGRIPVEWDVIPLGDLIEAIDPQPDHRTPQEVSGGIPYIGVSNFNNDGSIDFTNARKVSIKAFKKQQDSFSVSEGDFIFGKIGTIGMPSRLPTSTQYALSANVILLKPRETPAFFYWWISSPIVSKMVELEIHSTSQAAFGIKKMRTLNLPRPNKDEREKIGKVLDTQELVKLNTKRDLYKLHSLKTALMQDLLSGKKRVTPLINETEVIT
ncbi:restriction endonuclease subunit S [Syntrophomonas wolfei]|uniref:Restriction endonuclease S subunits-like protein n=1 Tax=Syntrophomonas wolfei subsp. wolfei (strain DSM 2245B / Goettingen) TaxID=335541 RepID=Q0AUQ6_SYNWW|nr:restriction endonuclease subunit S [Syntrophomonas wolfei]ABI69548.1 Restriction endonuclease S subunits-like protein [Syntrophomonas wolfei subsp. wolfei str. Goettingen G311]